MDGEHAAIRKSAREGVDRVAEPAPLPHLLEESRGHAAAKRAGQHLRGEIIGIAIGRRLEGEHEMGLLEGLVRAPDAARVMRAGRLGAVPLASSAARCRSASATSTL